MRAITEIEAEMKQLYPQKELAKIDYHENIGSSEELRDRLYRDYERLANQWNVLVDERQSLMAGKGK